MTIVYSLKLESVDAPPWMKTSADLRPRLFHVPEPSKTKQKPKYKTFPIIVCILSLKAKQANPV